MKLEEFKVGETFFCGSRKWLCTDVGTRVVIAVCLTLSRRNDWARSLDIDLQELYARGGEIDPSWVKGPPYAIQEHVFDEYDQEGCSRENQSDTERP